MELIEKSGKCPWWLAEFALAGNSADLLKTIREADAPLEESVFSAVLGYYYLKYRDGRLSLTECIRLCSDAYDSFFDEDTNEFYGLLYGEDAASADAGFEGLCAEYRAEAERQFDYIQGFGKEDLE